MKKIIVGLGNPGAKYAKTRHNVGWLVLDSLAQELAKKTGEKVSWQDKKDWSAQVAEIDNYLLAKPQTMMNNSGLAVRKILDYYQLLQEDLSNTLLVIQDELDLPSGTSRWSVDSRAAGHRGIESIIQHLGTKNFQRLRIGIKPEYQIDDAADFVLKNLSAAEIEKVNSQSSFSDAPQPWSF
ncbi:MAG TPA: aminoacyl-tRNA hydrolase [bacterium]|nr:aminoacyl-tRNA hydrolase [bacterium]